METEIRERDFEKEWVFRASRSSGPGGQNVNKVSTRVELRFHVNSSQLLDEEEKERITNYLGRYITRDGDLVLASQTERSQFGNRKAVTGRFFRLLEKALTPVKKRIKSRPTAASRKKRIENKKQLSNKKALRKIDPFEN